MKILIGILYIASFLTTVFFTYAAFHFIIKFW